MTGETTARADARKALDVLSVAAPLTVEVREAVETLSRALAGAPTADARHGVTPEPPAGSEHYLEGWRDGYSQAAVEWLRDNWLRDNPAPAVEPEGMDAADELHSGVLAALRAEGDPVQAASFVREAADKFADELTAAQEEVQRWRETARDRDARLMDALIENDEMADELTATERLAGWVNGGQYDAAKLRADVREVLRALTGFRSSTHAVGLALGLAPLGGAPIDGEAVLGRAREVAAELVASRRVRELHQPEETRFAVGMDMATGRQRYRVKPACSHCWTGDPCTAVSMDYPCPTVRALDGDTTEEQR